MYKRPKFLELLLEIRQEMARDADHDLDLLSELVRSGYQRPKRKKHTMKAANQPKDKSSEHNN